VRLFLDSANPRLCGTGGELAEITTGSLEATVGSIPDELSAMLVQVCAEQGRQNAVSESARECQACGEAISTGEMS